MSSEAVQRLISLVGLLAQLGGALLLIALFALLFRHGRRRRYFLYWGRAWLALAFALSVLVVRYLLLPGYLAERELMEPALHLAYQAGELLHLALLVAGTVAYCSGFRVREGAPYALAAIGAISLLSVALSRDLTGVLLWQSVAAVGALAYCSARFLRLPPSRRSLGSRAIGAAFGIMAAHRAVYTAAFGLSAQLAARSGPLGQVVQYGPYFDLLFQVLLGYGMVVLLMEDAKREVDDAHAELAVAHDRLRRDSLYDALTGCLNRRAFLEQVALEEVRASFGTVVMVDLDNLKTVNDTLGHRAGDDLLRAAAEVLRQATRPKDRLFRWGGDEFLLLMPGARAGVVQPLLQERITRAAGEAQTGSVRLLLSLGSADYEDAEGLEAAIRAADEAMYAQKALRKQPAEELSARS
ncbi:MAG TPA: GGDEF domain-containing protein [Longimicrobiaceae bacterium]|nr:GGDEF domain-containing protein [Longimicrobiaceae bacterium]